MVGMIGVILVICVMIVVLLFCVLFRLENVMALIDDLASDVQDESTVIDSAVRLLANLSEQLAAAGTDPVKLSALKDAIDANKAKLAAAIVKNTPSAPTAP